MSKRFLLACALLTFVVYACAAQAPNPEPASQGGQAAAPPSRKVQGRTLVSAERPAVRIEFDKAFEYAGAQSFILYDVAHAEQHFFVDADREKRVRRLYWVQFEGYLPTNNHTYDYSKVKERLNLGGLDFVTDAVFANIAQVRAARPDSDGARARAFLEGKGYRFTGNDFAWRRLVHLTDETRRDELLIIYLEDLSRSGLTAADLAPQGRAAARWPELSNQLLQRATKGMKISRL